MWKRKFKSTKTTLNLHRRKRVGVLGSEHWKTKAPKFNTPGRKAELKQFANSISSECSLPEAGFYSDGIEEHVRVFFSEQRRSRKDKIIKVEFLLLLL